MSLRVYSCSEPITEPDILESIRALPTEDDLPYWLMTISYGRHRVQALLDWCDETIATLQKLAKTEHAKEAKQ